MLHTRQNEYGHRPHNRVECIPFARDKFLELVQEVSAPEGGDWPANQQTVYLAAYLDSLGTKTLVVEHHYIDRHFILETAVDRYVQRSTH